jgi:hypothetical protein
MKKIVQASNMKRRLAFQTLDQAAASVIQSGNTEKTEQPAPAAKKPQRRKAMQVLITAAIAAAH